MRAEGKVQLQGGSVAILSGSNSKEKSRNRSKDPILAMRSQDSAEAMVVSPPHQRNDNSKSTTQPQQEKVETTTHSDYVQVEDTPSMDTIQAQSTAFYAATSNWLSSMFSRNAAASNSAASLKVTPLSPSSPLAQSMAQKQLDQQNSAEEFRDEPEDFSENANASLSRKQILYGSLFALMALGLVYGLYSNRHQLSDIEIGVDFDVELKVAFLGNAYLFVNDVPRLMETISNYKIQQNSVLHSTAGSLPDLLMRGNGMYYSWQTEAAILDSVQVDDNDEDGGNVTVYDFGLCTAAQLLLGQDEILTYGNNDNAYYNDGKNPCIVDEVYMDYIQAELDETGAINWDYIVLVDQTKRMAVEEARQESIYALSYAYAPLIQQTNAVPVILDTHAFWTDNTNMTGLGGSVEYFQALIYNGVQDYVDALSQRLSEDQQPLVAPIGVAYLTIYLENYDHWEKLFLDDQMHASVHGSYLLATVLYATMYGHLPEKSVSVFEGIEELFATARKLLASDTSDISYPSQNEAFYYRNVARRVVLQGYVPNILLKAIDEVGDGDE